MAKQSLTDSLIGGMSPTSPTDLSSTGANTNYKNIFHSLIGLSAKNPLGLNVQSVEDMLNQFKTSLLGGKKESELDMKSKTLLQQGTDVANRITARINTAAQAANSPGAAAQTRRNQSLLG